MDDLTSQEIRGYKIQDPIGEGGFGVVYRAYQSVAERQVVIKVILPEYASHPEFARRFEAEVHTIAKLEHPHIVPLYDCWRDETGTYLVMRHLKGGNLRDQLDSGGELELAEIERILDQICDALEVAHEANVVHRDLKPENILLDERGNAYLTDFGIAKDLGREKLTRTGEIIGSVDYLAPEQAKGEPITPQTDIYGLGVLLYEMLTGTHPFPELTTIQMLEKHLHEPLPSVHAANPELPEYLDQVIWRATAKDPEERFHNASELQEAYQQALALERVVYPPSVEVQVPAFLEEAAEEREVERAVFVARGRELQQLDGYLEKALTGDGQAVFVTGGPGRGKTALVEEF
ncbi:MAG: serine/threonine-protein kinase, partial [Anaerolineales bacterium]